MEGYRGSKLLDYLALFSARPLANNPEADTLVRELARIDGTSITDAVIVALRETIRNRMNKGKPERNGEKDSG
ncbi:type II toxin-antitoxin system VapB family antitoxin [Mesorhizobium sp. M0189]|uniref:type II toxin-antitoxin system VapB family antitoxin n=1 Tax=unclassified Mesorhizobium TaxID=325217 RepID=UPI00333CDC7D